MGGVVLFKDSQGRDGRVDLDPTGTVFVGRGLDCAIRTDDAMVSRKHSQIRLEGGRYVVEDLGSANGTLVNNNRVPKHVLAHNDVIQCGSLYMRYVEELPLVPVQAGHMHPAAGSPPPTKGGTMRLDAAPALPSPGPSPGPAPGAPGGFGAAPGMGGAPGMPPGGGGYGAPPGMGGAPGMPPG